MKRLITAAALTLTLAGPLAAGAEVVNPNPYLNQRRQEYQDRANQAQERWRQQQDRFQEQRERMRDQQQLLELRRQEQQNGGIFYVPPSPYGR